MARPQGAVCAEGQKFAVFLTATLAPEGGAASTVRRVASALPALTAALGAEAEEPGLASALGIGHGVWERVCGKDMPSALAEFAPLGDANRIAPATPADLFLHISSSRHDANFALAREVMGRLGEAVRLVEEIHGFRNFQGRDLTGFVDGTENPSGADRPLVALVGKEDPRFAGGSYVGIQRYVHDLAAWTRLSLSEQEAAIGRTKGDDVELDDEVKPPSAHIARVVIEEDGEELELLRQSLPYGTTAEKGLYFVGYGRSPEPFRKMLRRMVMRDADGAYDRLLDFTRAVTGASFFTPSVEFLTGLA